MWTAVTFFLIILLVALVWMYINEKNRLNYTPLPEDLLQKLYKIILNKEDVHYYKENYLLSIAERKFYEKLLEVIPDTLNVFPQMQISHIIGVKRREHQAYLNRIDRKSVDFVICSKPYLKPVLAIELDDSSHNSEERIKRDNFIKEVFEQVNLPLVRIKCKQSYDEVELKRIILSAITNI